MNIYKSRFTPGVLGNEIKLEIGEVCKYRLLDGTEIDVTIDSDRMTHEKCPTYGYEAIFSDNNEMSFVDGERIIDWKGRVA